MNYEICNISDEFEPRATPRPASRCNDLTVPSVPEVSLVFEKPYENNVNNKTLQSPMMCKYDTYAAWKKNKFSADSKIVTTHILPRVERSYSQSDTNHFHKNEINESLKHSKSDPSLAKRLEPHDPNEYKDYRTLGTIQEHTKTPTVIHRQIEGFSRNQANCKQDFMTHENQNVRQAGAYADNISANNRDGSQCRNIKSLSWSPQPILQSQNCNVNSLGENFDAKFSDRNPSNVNNPNLQSPSYNVNSLMTNKCLPNRNYNSNDSIGQNFQSNAFPKYSHPSYFELEHSYPFPFPYSPGFQNHKMENEETVKNLLQLVNNQSEQIKSLQAQVDRFLKIQEESLKERGKCGCCHDSPRQNTQLYLRSYDDALVANSTKSQKQGQPMERNVFQNTPKIHETENKIPTDCEDQAPPNLHLLDEQTRNRILEKKVSIGVMTSFEFTVQNNPFAPEPEEWQEYHEQTESELVHRGNNRNVSGSGEVLRKSQKPFSRMSNAQLENIIEDSESHLSSSRQLSSNFHTSPSTEESPERQSYMEVLKQQQMIDSQKRLECPGIYENTPKANDLNYKEEKRQRYLENQSQACLNGLKEDLKRGNAILSPSASNVNCPTENGPILNTPGKEKMYNFIDSVQAQSYSPQNNLQYQNIVKAPIVEENLHEHIEQDPKTMKYLDRRGQANMTKIRDSVECRNEKNEGTANKFNQNYCVEESLVLSSGEFEVNERAPPSPAPSIHVDMQEYSSDDDSERTKRTPKIGWTFYNNVLGQVNQILQNSPDMKPIKRTEATETINIEQEDYRNKALLDSVKITTMEQLKRLGISFVENTDSKELNSNKKVTFDSSYYPRLNYQANMAQATSAMSETDTSMQMKALALKYLSDEQLADLALQKQSAGTLKHLMLSNVQGTNMSFATMRYLERYQLLPGKNNLPTDDIEKENFEIPQRQEIKNIVLTQKNSRSPKLQRCPPLVQTPRTSCPSKILDISTLKQQPKLL